MSDLAILALVEEDPAKDEPATWYRELFEHDHLVAYA